MGSGVWGALAFVQNSENKDLNWAGTVGKGRAHLRHVHQEMHGPPATPLL